MNTLPKRNSRSRAKLVAGEPREDPNLTKAEIDAAKKLIQQAMQPRVLPVYSREERLALAVLAANLSLQQQNRGKKSRVAVQKRAERRGNHVDLLLRYIVDQRYRDKPNTIKTIMELVRQLDEIGIEASEPQVRRDIRAALERGPLPNR